MQWKVKVKAVAKAAAVVLVAFWMHQLSALLVALLLHLKDGIVAVVAPASAAAQSKNFAQTLALP